MREEIECCGGSKTSYIKDAPQTIKSDKMIYFSVSTKLPEPEEYDEKYVNAIDAFAVLTQKNETFIYLVKEDRYREKSYENYALIKSNIFSKLVKIVNKHNLANKNGRIHRTNGLPEDFGGIVDIEYASGEKIYIEDNQSPFVSCEAGADIIKAFEKFFKMEKETYPDISTIKSIRFREDRKNGGFTDILLSLENDGTWKTRKQQRFDDPKIYDSEKTANTEKIDKIKNSIIKSGILFWGDVPNKTDHYSSISTSEKQLTFIFENGDEIIVKENKRLPYKLGNGFFEIELAMMY